MTQHQILIGVTGSVAAYKAAELVRLLARGGHEVKVAMSPGAQRFVTPLLFEALSGRPVLSDLFARTAEIAHVERAHEAELVVVAPASANSIARFANGLADEPVSSIVLATRAPILLAPAMETGMWTNPATRDNVARLLGRGVEVVGPDEGLLASGRSGAGRMVEPEVIAEAALARLRPRPLAGKIVAITAGPTFEPLDPVRGLTNRSTGAMGLALAAGLARRGATVRLVLGPSPLPPPPGVELSRVETAEEMLAAARRAVAGADAFVAAAAVSDFRPAAPSPQKKKRSAPDAHTLELRENPDILATLAAEARGAARRPWIVGFAAETEDVEASARRKRAAKGCDWMVANRVGKAVGFGPGETLVLVIEGDGPAVAIGPADKPVVADRLAERLGERLLASPPPPGGEPTT